MASPQPQPLTCSILTLPYTRSSNRLLLFDYDGTLTPIVPNPPDALLSIPARQYLTLLVSNPKNTVWIISGRDRAFLTQHLACLLVPLGLCAEHGAFICEPGTDEWASLGASEDMGWKPIVCGMFDDLVQDVEGSQVEAKEAAAVWHYRRALDLRYAKGRAEAVVGQLREGCVGSRWDVEVVEGKCVVEVRVKRLGKGGVVERLLGTGGEGGGETRGWGFVGCWGDDRTDEDMFQALQKSGLPDEKVFSVKVGDGSTSTSAPWMVNDPDEVLQCMRWLNYADEYVQDLGKAHEVLGQSIEGP